MTRFVLRPRAQRDIEEIWDYSARTWGIDQAELYLRQIQDTLRLLAGQPDLGRSCDDIRPGYKRHATGAHIVFYRTLDDGVDVVRILHQRMNVEDHL